MALNPQAIGPCEEQYEMFSRRAGIGRKAKKFCQYDYRDSDGKLFSCVAPNLEEARARRDKWLASR